MNATVPLCLIYTVWTVDFARTDWLDCCTMKLNCANLKSEFSESLSGLNRQAQPESFNTWAFPSLFLPRTKIRKIAEQNPERFSVSVRKSADNWIEHQLSKLRVACSSHARRTKRSRFEDFSLPFLLTSKSIQETLSGCNP